jgi:GNAT superfamily N-acetyltransferase
VNDLADLVRRWQAGWSQARDWNSYAEIDGIIEVRIGLPDRMAEYVLADDGPDRLEVAAELALSDEHPTGASWVTVATADADRVRPQLEALGLEVTRVEWLMTVPLADQLAQRLPESYSLDTELQPGLIDVRVISADGLAAGGRMAVNGTDAVADMILTDPAHRRRGLGRAVMGALVAGAIDQGATDGLLMASADGLHLYRALGWSVVADVIVARSGQGIADSSDQRPTAQ